MYDITVRCLLLLGIYYGLSLLWVSSWTPKGFLTRGQTFGDYRVPKHNDRRTDSTLA